MRRDIKPPRHSYPWPDPIPAFPSISVADAASVLLNPEWTQRVIKERTLQNLRDVLEAVLARSPDYTTFYQVVFQDVVVQEADLRDLDLPLALRFQGVYFLDDVVLNNAKFSALSIEGNYVGGVLSLAQIRGRPSISLASVQIDDLRLYGAEVEAVSARTTHLGAMSVASCNVTGSISLFDSTEIRDVLMVEDVEIGQNLDLSECRLYQGVTIRKLKCSRIGVIDSDLVRELEIVNSKTSMLDVHGSSFGSTTDFRGLEFQQIDTRTVRVQGRVLLNTTQLRRHVVRRFRSGYDVPSTVIGDGRDDEESLARTAEQLLILRENFHRIPSMARQEDYCAYRLMEASRRIQPRSVTRALLWLYKWCFGYMIATTRVLLTVLLTILIASAAYAVFDSIGLGTLADSSVANGQASIFREGIGTGLSRCLYFSVITFTTVGYGDVQPLGVARVVAMIEAMLGVLLMPLFTVSVARRVLRW